MKKVILSILFISTASVFSSVLGQVPPPGAGTPAGAGDKNLADDGIKMRSVEIERMKREAELAEASSFAPINKEIAVNFPQIKGDFEGIQILQTAIVKAYTTGKTADYGLIVISADEINSKSKRLDSNLFAAKGEKNEARPVSGQPIEKLSQPRGVRDLIVALDTAIGNFVSSKIFGNIKVIEPEVAINTRTELIKIMQLSEELTIQAAKMKQDR